MTRRLSPSENYTQDQISQRQATMSRLSNMFDRAVFSVQFPNQCELFFFFPCFFALVILHAALTVPLTWSSMWGST